MGRLERESFVAYLEKVQTITTDAPDRATFDRMFDDYKRLIRLSKAAAAALPMVGGATRFWLERELYDCGMVPHPITREMVWTGRRFPESPEELEGGKDGAEE